MYRTIAASLYMNLFLLIASGCASNTSIDDATNSTAGSATTGGVATGTISGSGGILGDIIDLFSSATSASEYADSTTPKFHVWSYIKSFGEEPDGYATYSYVLAGKRQSDMSHSKRYKELISAIKSGTPSTSEFPTNVPRSELNVFLIPSSDGINDNNEGLSLSLVSILKASDARFSNPGPYIVTLYHPISFNADGETNMLFVDLTNTHPHAMSEIATAYKQHISLTPIHGIERLKSLKLALLNTLLIADNRIAFAKTAYAQLSGSLPK